MWPFVHSVDLRNYATPTGDVNIRHLTSRVWVLEQLQRRWPVLSHHMADYVSRLPVFTHYGRSSQVTVSESIPIYRVSTGSMSRAYWLGHHQWHQAISGKHEQLSNCWSMLGQRRSMQDVSFRAFIWCDDIILCCTTLPCNCFNWRTQVLLRKQTIFYSIFNIAPK